jgi:hypothetical protein
VALTAFQKSLRPLLAARWVVGALEQLAKV